MLRFKDGKVELMGGAESIPEVKALRSAARGNSRDKFFQDAITYAFFMYKKDGIYSSKFPKARAAEVGRNYFSNKDIWEKFEKNEKFQEFKEYYEELQYNAEERVLLSSEEEIEQLLLSLKDIKYYIDDFVNTEVMIPKHEGSDEMVPYKLQRSIRINNSKEKREALAAIEATIKMRKTMREAVKAKAVEEKVADSRSLLAKGEFGDD